MGCVVQLLWLTISQLVYSLLPVFLSVDVAYARLAKITFRNQYSPNELRYERQEIQTV